MRPEEIVAAIRTVRSEVTTAASHPDGKSVGLGVIDPGADRLASLSNTARKAAVKF
ncbi:MAG TPA: hypothetical protein VKV15_04170 [Bryobacteraceae bacterium]|nr:hypothetical protein [Bryobacteraceae bacterium]